ncbi:ABC transporter ATP-binding protein [Candidatus Poribacteria bacterium]|nr:ABC transporter ATP-binding protein [Candidatus Poribacteria bacterium]MBT5712882.1 ABC transporter ATP-binding protein [Candidatus Poribacteria bacterium]MBT7099452.1 ABC transporter ATP-binding protein [Candidatus Poribacteria bacterium]MBT7804983.1 ABC transporter ATP-binding protein [Candidatus Poribacteria bacterium]
MTHPRPTRRTPQSVAEVHLRDVAKAFGPTQALDGVELRVEDGEFFCLLGPSGVGKTTLLRTIAGVERPDRGEVWIGGRDVTHLPPAERDVAMVFETYALYPHLTVWENLAYPLKERRVPQTEIKRRVERTAELLGITHTLGRPPQTLSGGEMQRVAVGRAIVREAQVYLFDEPLSHLDAQLREHMRAELKRLHREMGSTLIYATPDQLEAMTMPDRVAVLRAGSIVQCDPPLEVYLRPKRLFVARYVGEPPMNFLQAEIDAAGEVQTAAFACRTETRDIAAGVCLVGVRPEDLTVTPAGSAAPPDVVSFAADVYAVEMCGDYDLVTLAVGDDHMKAIAADHSTRFATGQTVNVSFVPDRLYVIDPVTERVA